MGTLRGFFSYARCDDENDYYRITLLAEHIKKQFQLLTGENIEIFVDTQIKWGDSWKEEIEKNLSTTIFFIAVITPSYLLRGNCRAEVVYFHEKAKEIGNEKLFLPLLYVSVPKIEDEEYRDDDIINLIRDTEYEDWTEIRLKAIDTEEYRKSIDRLTKRLMEVNINIDHRSKPNEVEFTQEPTSLEDDEELGTLEKMAIYEQTMPELTVTMEEITHEIQEIGRIGVEKTREIENQVPPPSYSQRVEIMKRTAIELSGPGGKIRGLVNKFTKQIIDIDIGLRTHIEDISVKVSDKQLEAENVKEYFSNIRTLCTASREAKNTIQNMISSLKPLEALSRDMRLVIRALVNELTIMIETMGIMDKWSEVISETEEIFSNLDN